jgi:hypothetical protein
MRLGFLKWPFEGISVSHNYSVYNFALLKTKQPHNNFFSHPKKDVVFSQTSLELWLRRTPYAQKHIQPAWYDINDWHDVDCDALVIPYTWFLFFTKDQLSLLSQYKGKIILDETCDSFVFDENNNQEHIVPGFLKELTQLINFDKLYFLTSANVDNTAKVFFQNKLSNVKIISANVLMLMLSVSTLHNKQRIYSDEHIIHNFNNDKDKQFLLCAGRPRQYRLALIKFLTDNNLIDNSFVSVNLASDVGDSIQAFVDKYLQDIYRDKNRYMLSEFCDIEELKNYADTKFIPEYPHEYFRLENTYPKNNVYARSKYSIISETLFQTDIQGYNWITEKTCLPFVYGHPFLLFSMANTWEYLNKLGFESYTQFGAYDSITAPYTRFRTLCDSIPQLEEQPMSKQTLSTVLHNTNRFYSKDLQDSIVKQIINQLQ